MKKILLVLLIIFLITGMLFWSKFSYVKILPRAAGFEKPMTYLVLLQNNYEVRATGGYIGSFAVITIDKGKIKEMRFLNTNDFDKKSAVKIIPPEPLKKFLHVENWQLRDSNWSPDFPTAAKLATKFYNIESNTHINFDGVVAVNASTLPAILDVVGPVKIDGTEFTSKNAALSLEYEVERAFYDKGISIEKRKDILFKFITEVVARIEVLSLKGKKQLVDALSEHLRDKDILMYFDDSDLQEVVAREGWSGEIKKSQRDYVMIVDSNLGAFKSDMFVKRNAQYFVDLTDTKNPKARLVITYTHHAEDESWLTKDYRDFLRVYIPKDSKVEKVKGVKEAPTVTSTGSHLILANFIEVPLGQKRKVEYQYTLPPTVLRDAEYEVLIQKQAGIEELPVQVVITTPMQVKRLAPNKSGWLIPSKNQIIFKKTITRDEVFKVMFKRVDTSR